MRKTFRTLGLILLPPALFIPVGMAFGMAHRGAPSASIVPWILLVTEMLLASLAVVWLRRFHYSVSDLGFGPVKPSLLIFGVAAGLVLACTFQFAVAPAINWFRQVVGDVIPTAETRRALGNARVPFAIANIVLAPFVEELTYRGILERRIRLKWSTQASFFWGALAFGLLHWAGGIFFVVGTGGLGACLLYLRRRTGSLWPAIAAHLAFNTLEVALSLAS